MLFFCFSPFDKLSYLSPRKSLAYPGRRINKQREKEKRTNKQDNQDKQRKNETKWEKTKPSEWQWEIERSYHVLYVKHDLDKVTIRRSRPKTRNKYCCVKLKYWSSSLHITFGCGKIWEIKGTKNWNFGCLVEKCRTC